MPCFRIGLIALLLVCAAADSTLHAAEQWVLTTADFSTERVILRGLGEQGLSIQSVDGKARTVDFDRLLQVDRVGQPQPMPGGRRFILALVGGERIAGEPRGLDGETLVWASAPLGEIKVPLSRVRRIVAGGRSAEQAPSRTDQPAAEDVMILVNGDTVRGIVADVTGNSVTIQSTGGDVTAVPLDSVATVSFAAVEGGAGAEPGGRAFRVSLADSTTITAPTVRIASDRVTLILPDGAERKLPLAAVTSIEQVNGPVVWLSTRTPVENVQVPFLDRPAPTRMNESVTGGPIEFAGRTYARGIGVHAYSRLVWEVDSSSYQAFRTQYAIDGQLPYANVTVRIKLDDRVVHEQANFRAGVLAPLILLDLGGAKRLTLEVDYGETYDVQDRFNWIEPALLKHKPNPPAPPTVTPTTAPATQPSTRPMD